MEADPGLAGFLDGKGCGADDGAQATTRARDGDALAALAELARGERAAADPAQLDRGLATLRARLDGDGRRRPGARRSIAPLVAGRRAGGDGGARGRGRPPLRGASARPRRRPRWPIGSRAAAWSTGGYLRESGARGHQAVLRRRDGVRPDAGDAQPPAGGRRVGRAHRHRARHRFVPGHARAATTAGRSTSARSW